MKRRVFVHKPTEVEAIQVASPYKSVTSAFPRTHMVKAASGRLKHFHVVDAVGRSKAGLTDWIVKHPDGRVEVLSDGEFRASYEVKQ